MWRFDTKSAISFEMEESHSNLPDDVDALRAIIAAQADQLAEQARKLQSRDTLIDKLKAQLALLKRARFGSSSEKMDRAIEQLELALEDIEAAEAEAMALVLAPTASPAKAKPSRQLLPDHLPRHDVMHQAACSCPVCGGSDFIREGEVISEVLDYVPASFRVIRHIQPRFTCRGCDTQVRARMPSLPIERGKPGPGLVAHVLIAKYCDHLPLYRRFRRRGRALGDHRIAHRNRQTQRRRAACVINQHAHHHRQWPQAEPSRRTPGELPGRVICAQKASIAPMRTIDCLLLMEVALDHLI